MAFFVDRTAVLEIQPVQECRSRGTVAGTGTRGGQHTYRARNSQNTYEVAGRSRPMATLAALTFGLIALGTGVFIAVLTHNLERQPEYPTLLTDAMRLIGSLISLASLALGVIFLAYAVVAYVR
ncbi:hypothetical protein OB919_07335 [Halobacteria archaeon AArc-curdl1]|uniref:Uncharacterized protein n=1 Tax=Natronosalvus hydrolyticus TaxID=2979988 RepID=A0AAP3E712_9EURY|nr:hypothetical protein [Halobacteria archaeon AArc-curdl1]